MSQNFPLQWNVTTLPLNVAIFKVRHQFEMYPNIIIEKFKIQSQIRIFIFCVGLSPTTHLLAVLSVLWVNTINLWIV
jgi:hypothetical protein